MAPSCRARDARANAGEAEVVPYYGNAGAADIANHGFQVFELGRFIWTVEQDVKLAAHPDDPPVPILRQTPRLVYQPDMYQRLIDMRPSPASGLEFCLGSIAEMTEGDVYEATERYSSQGKVFYVHFRNVQGKVPNYREVFVDEGDIDMVRILRILRDNQFDGVLIPDHTPQMTCDAPWHAGMAYAMGYMKAAMRLVLEE